jgi:hypothetical protein
MGNANQARQSAQNRLPNRNGMFQLSASHTDLATQLAVQCNKAKDEQKNNVDWDSFNNNINNQIAQNFVPFENKLRNQYDKAKNAYTNQYNQLTQRYGDPGGRYSQAYQRQLNGLTGSATITATISRAPNGQGGYNYGFGYGTSTTPGYFSGELAGHAAQDFTNLYNQGFFKFPEGSQFTQLTYTHTYTFNTGGSDSQSAAPQETQL